MNLHWLLLLASLPCTVLAQTPTPAPRPAPVFSPEIKEGRNVTFRLKAPNAKEVLVRGQWVKEPLPLTLGAEGVWSGEASAVPAGVWEYSFVVDGLATIDPGNPAIKPMRQPRSSILDLPATPPAVWDFQDVPHGAVHEHSYLSKALGRPRELAVYTPPGYETDTQTVYPLLVLQHGSGDNEKTWVAHGHAHWILDNLIAAGQARPMIVVMLNGHPFPPDYREDPANRGSALQAFARELFEDGLPLVEARYRVAKEAAQRAIAGLSMGGGQSLVVGLGHLDRFAWIGSFSGGVPEGALPDSLLSDAATLNAKLRLFWIGVGQDDFLRARNEAIVAKLQENGVHHEWHLTEGGHAWPVWRQHLADFAPLLFQPARP